MTAIISCVLETIIPQILVVQCILEHSNGVLTWHHPVGTVYSNLHYP